MKHRKAVRELKPSCDSNGKLRREFLEIIKAARERKSDRILRIREMCKKTGRATSTAWDDDVRKGVLPPQISIGERAVGWKESEIDACIEARSLASRLAYVVDMRLFVQSLISLETTLDSMVIDDKNVPLSTKETYVKGRLS